MNSAFQSKSEKPLLLFVDDSAENLHILNALLQDDYRVKMAKSSEKYLEIAQS